MFKYAILKSQCFQTKLVVFEYRRFLDAYRFTISAHLTEMGWFNWINDWILVELDHKHWVQCFEANFILHRLRVIFLIVQVWQEYWASHILILFVMVTEVSRRPNAWLNCAWEDAYEWKGFHFLLNLTSWVLLRAVFVDFNSVERTTNCNEVSSWISCVAWLNEKTSNYRALR